MKYDLYFHNDFDGKASAALMLAFLESRGDSVGHYIPMEHHPSKGPGAGYFEVNFFESKTPGIVLDYPYHPGAAWWFDHHPTAFHSKAWEKKFRPDARRHLDHSYHSACHLVYDTLKKEFNWKPSAYLKELVQWLDVVDAARYASAEQVITFKEPALQAALWADRETQSEREARWFVDLLAHQPLAAIVAEPKIKKFVDAYRMRIVAGLAFAKKNIAVDGRLGVLDISGPRFRPVKEGLRFAVYYFYPRLQYSIRLTEKDGHFGLSVGANPWRPKGNNVDIGAFLKKRYGGGGHKNAGGAGFKTHAEAMKAVAEIGAFVNRKK